ncbi:MAG: hypothetical protein FWF82_07540, partial [Oscillospiraceae bacterium]|nr:hypothetical protein [Oscillospiraceae bacterium]
FKKASVMDIFLHTNAVLMDGGVSAGLIDSGVTFLCVSLDAATPQTYRKQRGADLDKVVKNIHAFLNRKTSPLPALRVSFLATPDNIHERDLFIDSWENVADFVEVQEYYKSYDSQPEELGAFQKSEKSEILERVKESESFSDYGKRLSIIAPDILSRSCGGVDVTEAIRKGDTLSKYGTVKNYWKQKESLQA